MIAVIESVSECVRAIESHMAALRTLEMMAAGLEYVRPRLIEYE